LADRQLCETCSKGKNGCAGCCIELPSEHPNFSRGEAQSARNCVFRHVGCRHLRESLYSPYINFTARENHCLSGRDGYVRVFPPAVCVRRLGQSRSPRFVENVWDTAFAFPQADGAHCFGGTPLAGTSRAEEANISSMARILSGAVRSRGGRSRSSVARIFRAKQIRQTSRNGQLQEH